MPWEFVWDQPKTGGFDWVAVPDGAMEWTVLEPRAGTTFRPYAPLRLGVALHRELAKCDLTREGFAAFAGRYGRLGEGVERALMSDRFRTVEDVSSWLATAAWLRETLRLWDAVQADDRAKLVKVIRWDGPRVHYVPSRELSRDLEFDPWPKWSARERQKWRGWDFLRDYPVRVRRGDVALAARLFVHRQVNADYHRLVGPAVLWDARKNRSLRVDVPRGLLGAIYAQFAQELLLQRGPVQCEVCGRYFDRSDERTGRMARSDRSTCSDACRSRAYRRRQSPN
jgi:hypothetical protein